MKVIRVNIPEKKYPVWIGKTALRKLESWRHGDLGGKRAFVIADSNLRSQKNTLITVLKTGGWSVHSLDVKATEKLKDFQSILPIYSWLVAQKADREAVIFALGGGVIGDAAGFIAGTYLRGIRWVGVPTTLLAQLDSAIGGKTAVNHPAGKNLIGVFHQPSLVICDLSLLSTLSKRDLLSGLGEAVKYGIALDPLLYRYLEKNWKPLIARDLNQLLWVVSRCVALKAKIVAHDEKDKAGIREILNFGHTIGHALESATRYKYYRHGEAVLLGMRGALHLSTLLGHAESSIRAQIEPFLKRISVRKIPSRLNVERVIAPIQSDKKSKNGKVRFVLLKDIGKTVSDSSVSTDQIREVLKELKD